MPVSDAIREKPCMLEAEYSAQENEYTDCDERHTNESKCGSGRLLGHGFPHRTTSKSLKVSRKSCYRIPIFHEKHPKDDLDKTDDN